MIDDKELIWSEIIDQYGDVLDEVVKNNESKTMSIIRMRYRGVELQIHVRFEVDEEKWKEPDCRYFMEYDKIDE